MEDMDEFCDVGSVGGGRGVTPGTTSPSLIAWKVFSVRETGGVRKSDLNTLMNNKMERKYMMATANDMNKKIIKLGADA